MCSTPAALSFNVVCKFNCLPDANDHISGMTTRHLATRATQKYMGGAVRTAFCKFLGTVTEKTFFGDQYSNC